MKFQKVNKKSKLDLIQSKMGLLRLKQSGRLYPKTATMRTPKRTP